MSKRHVGEIPEGFAVNKFGYLVKKREILDPVPKASSVKFKRPLSAHERVLQAIKVNREMEALDALPGDDTFDTEPIEDKTPHQLMVDPQTGEEMTAGEYVMLQHERAQAREDVAAAAHAARNKPKRFPKKKAKVEEPEPEIEESAEPDSDDSET